MIHAWRRTPRWLKIWTAIWWSVIVLVMLTQVVIAGNPDTLVLLAVNNQNIPISWVTLTASVLFVWLLGPIAFALAQVSQPRKKLNVAIMATLTLLVVALGVSFGLIAHPDRFTTSHTSLCDGSTCYHLSYRSNAFSMTLFLRQCDSNRLFCARPATHYWNNLFFGLDDSGTTMDDILNEFDLLLDAEGGVILTGFEWEIGEGGQLMITERGTPILAYDDGEAAYVEG